MQSRTRKIVIALVGLATLVAVCFDIFLSLDPDNYFFYRPEDRQDWVYHPGNVVLVCSVMTAEAALALMALIFPRPRALWLRCLFALALLGPWALVSTMAVVHMPMYALFHHAWAWALVLTLALVAIASSARQLYLRFRR